MLFFNRNSGFSNNYCAFNKIIKELDRYLLTWHLRIIFSHLNDNFAVYYKNNKRYFYN